MSLLLRLEDVDILEGKCLLPISQCILFLKIFKQATIVFVFFLNI